MTGTGPGESAGRARERARAALQVWAGLAGAAGVALAAVAAHRIESPALVSASTMLILHAGAAIALLAASVVHRVGPLKPGDQIVWVGVSSAHREAAFSACEFIMDFLKTRAPFWKKEHGPGGERWVEAPEGDDSRSARWHKDGAE